MANSAEFYNQHKVIQDDWTIVLPRRKNHKRIFPKLTSAKQQEVETFWTPTDIETTPERELALMHKMQISIDRLEKSRFFNVFLDQINASEASHHFRKLTGSEHKLKMVIYGIGSIESFESPRLQLSLAILMKRKLDWIGDMEVFDPVISLTESKVLEELGCCVLSINEQGKRQVVDPILFFMPHCEAELYDNLLKTNWRLDNLNQIILFGNSFLKYEQHRSVFAKSSSDDSRKHLHAVLPFTKEFEIFTVSDDYFRAFHGSIVRKRMGLIKDGYISGVLPTSKVFAVNYPGYPSSTERAVTTLGGSEGIAKARGSQSKNLKLQFRPEDPYSHPVYGEHLSCNHFLLKISKLNNSKGVQTDEIGSQKDDTSISGSEDKIYAEIVSHVSEAYHFNGMADYQHVLAVHADVARKKKRNWADLEPQFEKRDLIDADQEDIMILSPPLFSLKNTPENVVLKPSMYISLKKKQEGLVQHHWETDIDPSLAIDFNIKDVPKKVNWQKFIQEGTDEWKCQMAVCDLFNERPVWIKQSLFEHMSSKGLKLSSNIFKRLLFREAYYFANGPFLRFWIRKGYDPRKDPESRIFQRIDFRVPPPLRSYCDTSGLKHKWEDLCAFRVFPFKCQTSLQLFELADDYIKEEIRKPLTQTICTLSTGWFPSHILEMLRLRVAVRYLSVYPIPGAESFLKSASLRFEKSKRTKTRIKEHIVNEDEHQTVNKDEVHNEEEKEMSDDEADDDMEYGDFDSYEGLDMANSLPEESYINEENISKNYLQDLFGSFRHNGGTQDADKSDDEYQIYDQYSDGSDFDKDY